MKNALIGQSGGPTAVINASLAGAMEYAFSCAEIGRVYGMINGIKGALHENFMDLTAAFRGNAEKLEQLKLSPAMYLGSCRYKIAQDDDRDCARMLEILEKHNIGYFFYIGGNDSMDTVLRLSRYAASVGSDIRFVGIPKTIDNDLPGIDHAPGFGSAAKFVSAVVKDVSYDTSIYAIKSVHIIETMGRNAGWLAASSALARDEGHAAPHLIYMPEVAFSDTQFIADVGACLQKHNSVIIVVAEGLRTENGEYISAQNGNVDRFGHVMLCGAGLYEVALLTCLVVTVLVLVLENIPASRAPMMLVVNLADADQESRVLDITRKYSRFYKVRSRNLTGGGMDMIVEVKVKDESAFVKEVCALDTVQSASLIAHDGEVTF